MLCNNTTIYNGLLRAIDEGRPVIIMDSDAGEVNYVTTVHVFSDATIGLNFGQFIVTPSDGYSSSDLYTPQNITPTGTYSGGGGSSV